MQRRRDIAGAPERTTGATWTAITELIVATLSRSSDIEAADVRAALDHAGGAGRRLVGGRHLSRDPLVVVGEDFWLEIFVISGDGALTAEENLNPGPGGASVNAWCVHLPAVGGIADVVKSAAAGHANLSADPPTAVAASAASADSKLDLAALAAWSEETS